VRVTAVAVRDSLLRSSSLIMKRNRKLRKIRKRNEKKAGHGVRYRFAACKTLSFGHFCGKLPKTPRKSPLFFKKKGGSLYIYIYIYIKPLYLYIQKKTPKKIRACPRATLKIIVRAPSILETRAGVEQNPNIKKYTCKHICTRPISLDMHT